MQCRDRNIDFCARSPAAMLRDSEYVLSGNVILPPYGRPVFGSMSVGSSSTSFSIVITARAVKRAFGCCTPVKLLNW
jgi:hypothetical protein